MIDTGNNEVTATVNVDDTPYGVAVSPGGRHLYVTNYQFDTVSVSDTGVR